MVQLLALDMVAQGVDQHSGCGYVLGVHMARRLDMVVMDMHVVPLLNIAVLVVHVVDMVVEFRNMLKQLPVFNMILKDSSTWWRSVV